MFELAILYHHLSENQIGFVVMYPFTFFFANFGPDSTIFIIPAEIFPPRLRSTCRGISAVARKAGAIVGARDRLRFQAGGPGDKQKKKKNQICIHIVLINYQSRQILKNQCFLIY